MQSKAMLILKVSLLFLVLLFSCAVYAKEQKYYGSWQYTVKVEDTSMFNEEGLINEFSNFKNPNIEKNLKKKTFYISDKKMKSNDIFYTGFFKLSRDSSSEVIGSYFPNKFANPYDFAPIKILQVKKLSKTKTELQWFSNFSKKSLDPEYTLWIVKAVYDDETQRISGKTIVYGCPQKINCKPVNFARWNAIPISDISYFTEKNHRWKPFLSSILNFLDPSGLLDKALLKRNSETDDNLSNYSTIGLVKDYLQPNVKAMLPAHAGATQPDQALQQICQPSYCSTTARFWRGANEAAGQKECERATTGRRSLCCNPMGSGGGEMKGADGSA
ncbi:MAG: hypothetical protein SFU25_10545, partial [Candidatus Caenarcaniphilales bacterium]|nr:hypothetical protein [Candidatus Caenarcaniphilales bacterium]